jgi:hypothetical protein
VTVVHADTGDVGRQQIGGELHATGDTAERCGDRLGEAGLAGARLVLDEQVTFSEQAGDGQAHRLALAAQDVLDVLLQAVEGQPGAVAVGTRWLAHMVTVIVRVADAVPPRPSLTVYGIVTV